MNRVKTLEQKAMLKMTITLVFKLDCTLESPGQFWEKTLMHEIYPLSCWLNRCGVWPGHLEF